MDSGDNDSAGARYDIWQRESTRLAISIRQHGHTATIFAAMSWMKRSRDFTEPSARLISYSLTAATSDQDISWSGRPTDRHLQICYSLQHAESRDRAR